MSKNKITINCIKEYIAIHSPETQYVSGEYISNKSRLMFLCKCGKHFYKNWSTIKTQQKCMCNSCSKKDGHIKRKIDNKINLTQEMINLGFIPFEDITNIRTKYLVENQNGYKGYINLDNARKGKMFSIFSYKFNKENLKYNLNRFLKIYNLEDMVKIIGYICESNSRRNDIDLICKCSCGRIYKCKMDRFLNDKQIKCKSCSHAESNVETLAYAEILRFVSSVDIVKQATFEDCRNPKTNRCLKFDFYIPKLNLIIEIDGPQHRRTVNFAPQRYTKEQLNEQLKELQFRDGIKNQYCENNNIMLYRIECTDNSHLDFLKEIDNIFI